VISDYQQVHFTTEPKAKYEGFAKRLAHQAPAYYADADVDVGYATPDAVTIATVHQAKGLQWPAEFLPAMRKNRFPSRVMGGISLRHVIPDEAIDDPARYRGNTRGSDPVAVRRRDKGEEVPLCDFRFDGAEPAAAGPLRILRPHRRAAVGVYYLGAELKYLFECHYQFKLRFLYGFNAPIHEAPGYGRCPV
jgi:DNA helicase-2/ATP-dependent DNA helicase PcrA